MRGCWKTAAASLACAVFILLAAGAPNAATISFTNWSESGSDTVIPVFTVSDDPDGKFKVTVEISASSPNQYGEITGIFFDVDTSNGVAIVESDITGETVGGGTTHTHWATNTNKINGVTNISPLAAFDYVLGYKDGNEKGEVPIMFFVADQSGALTLDDWERVGVRWQVVGENGPGSGSDKEESTSVVPIPGAAWLFGTGLLALFGFVRRKRAANV
jgi:hypothetical protein